MKLWSDVRTGVSKFFQRLTFNVIVISVVPLLVVRAYSATNAMPDVWEAKSPQIQEVSRLSVRRAPPRVAVEACMGKNEGDVCSFSNQNGIQEGECRSGNERIFACRPYRREVAPGGVAEPAPRQADSTQVRPATDNPPPFQPLIPESEPDTPPRKGGDVKAASRTLQPDITAGTALEKPSIQSRIATAPGIQPVRPEGIKAGQTFWNIGAIVTAALIAAGFTWLGFYRYSTLPLRRLRRVTQQLATGNLSARVGEGLVHRKDEIADLGRDVDRMAERIEGLLSAHQRLIRDVSHELRSPLARLNVALELARQSAGPAHAAPFDRIERESGRLNELIGQLLMLTKLESDGSVIKREYFDMSALVVEIVQDVDFEARGNDRQVIITAAEPLVLNGNRELLRQAVENLVRNAARYTAAGTAVEISLRNKDAGGRSWAHIEVKDYGPGVPESELCDIFRPFYRVNDARERQSGGTGVGLAISDRAVRLHGGSLTAFNAPGTGLVMEMELPLT